jgi:tellurite resistance protein
MRACAVRQSRHCFFVAAADGATYFAATRNEGCPMSRPTTQEAMIYLMVIMSASDRDMRDSELARMGAIIRTLPIFHGFDQARALDVAQECQRLLQEEPGLNGILATIRDVLPQELRETAYALAVDIAAADLSVGAEETRMLDIIRQRFEIDALAVAAIERAASIRHRTPYDMPVTEG